MTNENKIAKKDFIYGVLLFSLIAFISGYVIGVMYYEIHVINYANFLCYNYTRSSLDEFNVSRFQINGSSFNKTQMMNDSLMIERKIEVINYSKKINNLK